MAKDTNIIWMQLPLSMAEARLPQNTWKFSKAVTSGLILLSLWILIDICFLVVGDTEYGHSYKKLLQMLISTQKL